MEDKTIDNNTDKQATLTGTTPRKPSIISRPQRCHQNPVSHEMRNAGYRLYNAILALTLPSKLLNCKKNGIVMTCISGQNLINWLCEYSRTTTRQTALGAWQVLIVEGVLLSASGTTQGEMHDNPNVLYYFHCDVCRKIHTPLPTNEDSECVSDGDKRAEEDRRRSEAADLDSVVKMLLKRASDAYFRMVLQKPSTSRTPQELEYVFNELLQIKSLSHLSTMILRQLTQVLIYEAHHTVGEVLFNQGDEGKSWYIILRGAVDVHIQGKGVVCSLHEGDDFGKLALVNNAPRAATLILRDDNSHFLRVDKDDFNSILLDVEANKVRLKEHDKDVLVLGRECPIQSKDPTAAPVSPAPNLQYSILAGTPEKMLEHLLQSICDATELNGSSTNSAVEDFILTHTIFMSSDRLAMTLKTHFMSDTDDDNSINYGAASIKGDKTRSEVTAINKKRSVVSFLNKWNSLDMLDFSENLVTKQLVEDIFEMIVPACRTYPSLTVDSEILKALNTENPSDQRPSHKRISNRSRLSKAQNPKTSLGNASGLVRLPSRSVNQPSITVYLKDHTYRNLHLPLNSSVRDILRTMSNHLDISSDDLLLVEVRSDGDKNVYEKEDFSVTKAISVNGRLFVTRKEDVEKLTPLPEQSPLTEIPNNDLLGSINWRDLANHMTYFDGELFEKIRITELISLVFGRRKFFRSTANLDIFIVQFSRVQFWVVTHILLTQQAAKRVSLLKKFIKTSQHLLELNNFSSFFAIMMGLNNSAVSRLTQTWDRLPSKQLKLFEDLCYILDPSRNHRSLRQTMEKLEPPIIPFLAILLKDMTFTHEGNPTLDPGGLVNFEKMQLIGKSLRYCLQCRSKSLVSQLITKIQRANSTPTSTVSAITSVGGTSTTSASAVSGEMRNYVRSLECIDDQKVLTQLSQKLEPPSHKN